MSQCHADETALQECQEGFNKLAKLLKQIHDDNIAYRARAEQRNREISNWDDQHRIQLQRVEAGKTAPPGYVFVSPSQLHQCK
jgi:hypothetical protein